jgi:hypothetical protein
LPWAGVRSCLVSVIWKLSLWHCGCGGWVFLGGAPGVSTQDFTCKTGTLLLEPHLQFIFLWLLWRFPVWPRTDILLVSASQVARITGMSHWCLATLWHFISIHILLAACSWNGSMQTGFPLAVSLMVKWLHRGL